MEGQWRDEREKIAVPGWRGMLGYRRKRRCRTAGRNARDRFQVGLEKRRLGKTPQ